MGKKANTTIRFFYTITSILYSILLFFFYQKYVPLIRPFQLALAPVLFIIFLITSFKVEWGVLGFIFAFPLINNLPYFFGIYGHIPHAPTALVLFLFFFLGWLVNRSFADQKINTHHPVFRPLFLLSLVILISGIITFFRYANFWPFLSPRIYELICNVNGVSSGGAIMSGVFNSLNYLSGMAFFIVIFHTLSSRPILKKIFVALSISIVISLLFSFVQKYHSLNFGNTPFWVAAGQINSTFKDPNSFGACLSAFVLLFLGVSFFSSKYLRLYLFAMVIIALFVSLFIGSRSSFLGMMISLAVFLFLVLFSLDWGVKRKLRLALFLSLILIIVIASAFIFFKESNLIWRLRWSLESLSNKDSANVLFTGKINLWTIACQMIADYPLTGVGLGAFIIELPNYAKLMGFPHEATDSAENYFFQAGSELGIIGLFLLFWLFVEIFRQMQRTWKHVPSDSKYRFILIGAGAGLTSLFINYLFHSYIGSYEVNYTFWLLVGLIFSLGTRTGPEDMDKRWKAANSPERSIHWSNWLKALGVILALIYSAVHLWNSTHSLSLKNRTKLLGIKQDFGFYQSEKAKEGMNFRWTREYGGLTVQIKKPVMRIPILASHPDIQRRPVKVRVYLVKEFFKKKKLLKEILLTQSAWQTYEFYLPDEAGQEVILLFEVSRTWNPLKWLGTPDPRNLGVAIADIELKDEPGI